MRKYLLVVGIVFILVIGVYSLINKRAKRDQVNYQKELVLRQSTLIGTKIEQIISGYENDLTKILFIHSNSLNKIFSNEKVLESIATDLRTFLVKYKDLVTNIAIFDNQNKYLGIYIKENDEFVLDTFPRQRINNLYKRDIIIKRKGYYQSYFPFFKGNELFGNVEVEINILGFLKRNLDVHRINDLQWQWLVDNNNQVIFSNRADSIKINNIQEISRSILEDKESVLEHSYTNSSGRELKIISAVYPLDVLNNDVGIIFSRESSGFMRELNRTNLILFVVNFLVLAGLIAWLIYRVSLSHKAKITKEAELLSTNRILEEFPVGIMIQDSLGKIKYLNRTGRKMLFIKNNEDVVGKTWSNQLVPSNKYILKEELESPFDSNHFIHYEKERNEVVIYRKDVKVNINGEDLILSGLIDVSALEKSRKKEAAANRAKSDFLAKMSHEIRTSMNAIMNVSDNLLKGKLNNL